MIFLSCFHCLTSRIVTVKNGPPWPSFWPPDRPAALCRAPTPLLWDVRPSAGPAPGAVRQGFDGSDAMMDWFCWENRNRKPSIFPLKKGLSCKISLKPIHWLWWWPPKMMSWINSGEISCCSWRCLVRWLLMIVDDCWWFVEVSWCLDVWWSLRTRDYDFDTLMVSSMI